MYTRNKPNEAYIGRQIRQQAATSSISILKQLATKVLSEVENIDQGGQRPFDEGFSLYEHLQKIEMDIIRHSLYLANGKQSDAAVRLGIKTTTLNAKIKRYQIDHRSPYQLKKR